MSDQSDLNAEETVATIAAIKEARARDPAAKDGDVLERALSKLNAHLNIVARFQSFQDRRKRMR